MEFCKAPFKQIAEKMSEHGGQLNHSVVSQTEMQVQVLETQNKELVKIL